MARILNQASFLGEERAARQRMLWLGWQHAGPLAKTDKQRA